MGRRGLFHRASVSSVLTGVGRGHLVGLQVHLNALSETRTLSRSELETHISHGKLQTLVSCRVQTVRFNYQAIFWTAARVCVPER